jgi:hypothetical protein
MVDGYLAVGLKSRVGVVYSLCPSHFASKEADRNLTTSAVFFQSTSHPISFSLLVNHFTVWCAREQVRTVSMTILAIRSRCRTGS